jgi:hypothetical protein
LHDCQDDVCRAIANHEKGYAGPVYCGENIFCLCTAFYHSCLTVLAAVDYRNKNILFFMESARNKILVESNFSGRMLLTQWPSASM